MLFKFKNKEGGTIEADTGNIKCLHALGQWVVSSIETRRWTNANETTKRMTVLLTTAAVCNMENWNSLKIILKH